MSKIFPAILSVVVFLAAIWIVVPAPHYYIWLFAVAASEWSLWLAALSLIAIIFSIYVYLFSNDGKFQIIWLVFSTTALIISLYPVFSVQSVAVENNVSLSFTEYFSGLKRDNSSKQNFTTRVFASVDGNDLNFDVYSPTVQNENNGAAIIVVHGGSWQAGTRGDFPNWNEWLARNGFTVFDVDYRLVPQPNYLTATGDVKCAVRFVKNHHAEFNVAPDRIAVFGRSAGAHLALLAAFSADDARLPSSCSENDQTEQVRAVVAFYAPTDLLWSFDHPANQMVIDGPKTLADFLGGNPHESVEIRERFILASPTAQASPKTPPTLLVHGSKDQLVNDENMQILDEKLNEAQVAHRTILIPYAQHGFDFNFHGFGSQIVKPAMLKFLRENTKTK